MMDPDDAAYQDLVDLVEQFGLGGVTFFSGKTHRIKSPS